MLCLFRAPQWKLFEKNIRKDEVKRVDVLAICEHSSSENNQLKVVLPKSHLMIYSSLSYPKKIFIILSY